MCFYTLSSPKAALSKLLSMPPHPGAGSRYLSHLPVSHLQDTPALNLSSLPPAELNNNQKYPVISSASPVICLMLARSGTACLCQDQKSHGSHVMSAYINTHHSPCLPSLACCRQEMRLRPPGAFFLPLARLLPFGSALVEGTGTSSPSRQLSGSWTPLHTQGRSKVDHGPPRDIGPRGLYITARHPLTLTLG